MFRHFDVAIIFTFARCEHFGQPLRILTVCDRSQCSLLADVGFAICSLLASACASTSERVIWLPESLALPKDGVARDDERFV